jgi:amidase
VKAPRALAPPIVSEEVEGAVTSIGEVLRSLGHSVARRDPSWGQIGNGDVPLYLAGIAEHFGQVPHPELLERRTRGIARLGRAIPERVVRGARAGRAKHSARVNALFDDFDVLLTPAVGEPAVPIGRWEGRGALWTLLGMSRTYPFAIPWNYLGNPAAAIPAGLTDDGVPLSVQLIAAPNREDLLLSLGSQLEAELEWPSLRPPIS